MEQATADYLMDLDKVIVDTSFVFPKAGDKMTLNVASVDGSETFLLDINRAGMIRLSRCTFQERYGGMVGLLRLDLDETKPHKNPDDFVIVGPHIHIYKEGYDLRWAYLLSEYRTHKFTDIKNLHLTFQEFCETCNISDIPYFQGSL